LHGRFSHDVQKHVLKIGLADLDVLGVQAGFANRGQVLLYLVGVVRGELHNSTRNTSLPSEKWRKFAINFEPKHVAGRGLEQIGHLRQRHHAALLEHGNAAAQGFGLFKVVRGQQHRVALLVESGDELPQRLAQFHIHAGGGLVQHDHRWLVHQCLRHQHPALHATGELAHVGIGLVGQTEAVQQFVDPGIVVLDPEVAGLEAQGLADIEEGVEHQFLRHDAQATARLREITLHVVPLHQHPPLAGARQTGQDADQGGLAGAIGSEQPEKLAFFDVEADVVKGLEGFASAAAPGRKGLGNRLKGDRWHERCLFYGLAAHRYRCAMNRLHRRQPGSLSRLATPYKVASCNSRGESPRTWNVFPLARQARRQASSTASADESNCCNAEASAMTSDCAWPLRP
jgi:hypothetical protein